MFMILSCRAPPGALKEAVDVGKQDQLDADSADEECVADKSQVKWPDKSTIRYAMLDFESYIDLSYIANPKHTFAISKV